MNVSLAKTTTSMKKTYIAPSVIAANIQVEEMIAASLTVGQSTSGMGSVSADSKERIDAVSGEKEETWGNLW